MTDRTLKDLVKFVIASPELPWGDFSCTPVLEFDAHGKALSTVKRCAVTVGGVTTVVELPQHVTRGKGHPWPPKSVIDAMMEAVGPVATV